MLINEGEYKSVERKSNIWIALISSCTDDEDIRILHNFGMVKFEMPDNEYTKKMNLKNCQQNAIWFYLNNLDHYSTMSNDRMINADDLDAKIVDAIPYKKLGFGNEPATIDNYIKKGLYGYKAG